MNVGIIALKAVVFDAQINARVVGLGENVRDGLGHKLLPLIEGKVLAPRSSRRQCGRRALAASRAAFMVRTAHASSASLSGALKLLPMHRACNANAFRSRLPVQFVHVLERGSGSGRARPSGSRAGAMAGNRIVAFHPQFHALDMPRSYRPSDSVSIARRKHDFISDG